MKKLAQNLKAGMIRQLENFLFCDDAMTQTISSKFLITKNLKSSGPNILKCLLDVIGANSPRSWSKYC